MKYINNRDQFITDWRKQYTTTNEAFDMSGGSGPMGNDINWGDSLVGRMFNSIFRKIGVGKDLLSINNVIKAIQKEFESIKIESQANNVDKTKISRLHISYLLEALTRAVHSGTKVIIIKSIAEETINIVDKSELPENDKLEAIEELEAFLKFLEQYDDEVGEDLSDELTGIDSEEEKKAESVSSGGWGEKTYSGMVTMMGNLIKVIENKDNVSTTAQGEKEDVEKAKDINYVLNRIIDAINIGKKDDEKFTNDLLSKSKDIKWPILEVSGNKIIYRKYKTLVELKDEKQIIVNIPKWSDPKDGGSGWVGKSEPRLEDFNKKTITRVANYIVSQLKDINSVINSDKDFKLNDQEIKWFNENIKGKWLVIPSQQGNAYKTEIGSCDTESRVIFLTKPVKGQTPTNVNSILSRGGKVFNSEDGAVSYYDEIYKSGGSVLSNKGKVSKDDPKSLPKKGIYNGSEITILGEEGENYRIQLENGKIMLVPKSQVKVKIGESYEFLLEKSRLSEEETDANQALSRLKLFLNELITDKSKSPAIDLKFLTSLKGEGSKSFMNTFGAEIKSKYNQISEGIQKTPLYKSVNENIEMVDDTLLSRPKKEESDEERKIRIKAKTQAKSLRSNAAEKIARFASVSMLFVGEGLYSELGELGKHLNKFNNDFQKLLNTEFKTTVEKTEEKRVFSYSDFMSINEKKTQQEISEEIKNYYDENVSYEKWKVTKEEVQEVDREIENSKPAGVSYDRIIRIVKLFNKAHKIHTTDVIPSGRRSGKVSNRVFREYEYVGDGNNTGKPVPEGGVEPGVGPYRNKKVFNKFEEAILSIIEDKDFRDFFSEDVKVTNLDGTESIKSGDGKILMKFMNDLLDGDKLYRSGAQSKFFQEYFGFKVDDKDFGGKKIEKKTDSNKENEKLGNLRFDRVSEIKNITNSVNVLSIDKTFVYFVIIDSDDSKVYIKYSTNFGKIDKYIDNKIDRGDISSVSNEGDIFYASTEKDNFPISKDDVDFKTIKALDIIENSQSNKTTKSKFQTNRGIYALRDEEKKRFKVKNIFTSVKSNDDITKDIFISVVKPRLR
jgi:hypothetical protein